MTYQTTDIWFRTNLTLEQLAVSLKLKDYLVDAEDYWEWVIGVFGKVELDVTRTHRVAPNETETRIFRVDRLPFSLQEIEEIVTLLRPVAVSSIRWGEWSPGKGNDYRLYEVGRTV